MSRVNPTPAQRTFDEGRLMQVLVAPIVSEKATMVGEKSNAVTFKVLQDATKPEIKAAVELMFKVEVKGVSVANIAFGRDEHRALLAAYMTRAQDDAVFVASRHLGRTALAVIGYVAPDFEPRAIRHALAKTASASLGAPSVLSVVGEGPIRKRKASLSESKRAAEE